MTMIKVHLIDYYSFPRERTKRVGFRQYRCGLDPLITTAMESVPSCQVSLYITGGPFDGLIPSGISVHDSLANKLMDFSGYLRALDNISSEDAMFFHVFANSSCPPAYLKRLIRWLERIQQQDSVEEIFAGPGGCCLYRRAIKYSYLPHIQSYCYSLSGNLVPQVRSFIAGVEANSSLIQKKDYILRLEIGLSRYLLRAGVPVRLVVDPYTSVQVGNHLSRRFHLFDSRMTDIEL